MSVQPYPLLAGATGERVSLLGAVRDLVSVLRRAAGIAEDGADPGASAPAGSEAPPDWLDPGRVVATLDADAMLDAGEVPLGRVNQAAESLAPGELLRIDSSFRPAPLVEAIARQGFRSFTREAVPGRFESFVSRV